MDVLSPEYLFTLVATFFMSLQVRILFGLIVLDLLLGIAAALRSGVFDFRKIGLFYVTMVAPYTIGYLAFWLVIGYLIPPAGLTAIGNPFDGISGWDAALVIAWGFVVSTLLGSVVANFKKLYPTPG